PYYSQPPRAPPPEPADWPAHEPAPEPAPPPEPEPEPEPEVEAAPPVRLVQPSPRKPTPPPPPPPPPPPTATAEARPEATPAPQAEDDPFDAVLRSVEQLNRRVEGDVASPGTGSAPPTQAAGGQAVTQAEIDAYRRCVERYWNVIGLSRSSANQSVRLGIDFEITGQIRAVRFEEPDKLNDPGYRALAESARRAVYAAQGNCTLPADKYSAWQRTILNFKAPL
ncbi:MAG: hypothetical protein ACFB3T_14030, partial [Geminicoccaceae bacterium]